MPPDESFWKYVTSATELLGTDEGNPVIGSAPIYVASSSDEEGTDYAALIKKSVRREELLALLEGASPVRGMNAFAIDADWRMPDETETNNYYRNLLALHTEGLGNFWQLFERYRHLFLRVLNAQEKEPFATLQDRRVRYNTAEDLEACFRGIADKIRKREMAFLLNVLLETRGASMRLFMSEIGRQKKWNRLQQGGANFAKWDGSLLRRFIHEVIASQLKLTRDMACAFFDSSYVKFPLPGDNGIAYVNNNTDDARIVRTALDHENISDGKYVGQLALIPLEKGSLRASVLLLQRPQVPSMYPLLRWRKEGDGSRQWNYDALEGKAIEDGAQLVRDVEEELQGDQALNPLLGLIALANIRARTIVETWPKRMALPDSVIDQRMSSAQVPVLVPMHESDLLDRSPLLPALENLAHVQ